jgi:hypothetical protein
VYVHVHGVFVLYTRRREATRTTPRTTRARSQSVTFCAHRPIVPSRAIRADALESGTMGRSLIVTTAGGLLRPFVPSLLYVQTRARTRDEGTITHGDAPAIHPVSDLAVVLTGCRISASASAATASGYTCRRARGLHLHFALAITLCNIAAVARSRRGGVRDTIRALRVAEAQRRSAGRLGPFPAERNEGAPGRGRPRWGVL